MTNLLDANESTIKISKPEHGQVKFIAVYEDDEKNITAHEVLDFKWNDSAVDVAEKIVSSFIKFFEECHGRKWIRKEWIESLKIYIEHSLEKRKMPVEAKRGNWRLS